MEEWKDVGVCPAYEINRAGCVRHKASGRIKAAVVGRPGYPVLNLWQNGKGKVVYLHRILAAAFIGSCPPGWTVNHIDGDRLNNSLANLEYLSNRDNVRDCWAAGRGPRGERAGGAKLTEGQAVEIHRRANAGERTTDLAREFGVGKPIVSQIKRGDRWAHAIAAASFS